MNATEYSDFICPIKFCCGKLSLETLPSELRIYGSRKPLVLFSIDAVIKGFIDPVVNAFKESEMVIGIYDSVPEIPSIKVVKELSELYHKNGHDSIIAVGSGAVMHLSKVLNIVVSGTPEDLSRLAGKDNIKKPLKPFFVVPTASGTGLMANGSATVEDVNFSSRYLIPDYVVLDPRIVQPERTEVVADSALRALTSSCEAYALPAPNQFVSPYAYLAIQGISENLINTVNNADAKKKPIDSIIMPETEKGRMAVLNAAILGGFISSCLPAGLVYRLGEALSNACRLPSGICMGLLLPYGLEYNMIKNGYHTDELLLALAGPDTYSRTPESQRSLAAMEMIRDIQNQLFDNTDGSIPRMLSDLNLTDAQLQEVAGDASEGNDSIDKAGCLMILTHASKGTPIVSV